MANWISKSYTDQDFGGNPSDQDKVEIFRDRVTGWQIGIARELVGVIDKSPETDAIHHAGYAVLSILTNYFEMIWQHMEGSSSNRQSGDYFARGFKSVYPGTPLSHDEIKDIVYHRLRCGMYHDGYTRRGVTIKHDYPADFNFDRANDVLKVNPHSLVGTIEKHFAAYIATLKSAPSTPSPINPLTKFLRIFNLSIPLQTTQIPPVTAAPPPAAPQAGYQTPSAPRGSQTPSVPSGSVIRTTQGYPQGGQGGSPLGGLGGPGPSGVP